MEFKLNFELVPDGCWGYNLRSILSKTQWDFLKKDARERSGGKCAICGKLTTRLDAHERWSSDETSGTVKLEDVIAVCKDCHSVMHIGYTQLKGDVKRAEEHFMKVNGCSYAQMREALGKANEEHQRRNKVGEWKMDLSYFKRFINE